MTHMSLLLAAISLGACCGSDSPPIVNTSGTAFPPFLEPYVPVEVRRDTDLTATEEVWFYPELEGDVHTMAYTRPETGLHILLSAGEREVWTVHLRLNGVDTDEPSGEAYAYRHSESFWGNDRVEHLEHLKGEVVVGTGDPRPVEFRVDGWLGWFRSVTLRGGLVVEPRALESRVPRAAEAKGRGR